MDERYCWCSRCVPNDIAESHWVATCSACGQEIRFGERDGRRAWHHRQPVDHHPCLGHRVDMSGQNAVPEPEPTEEEIAAKALQEAKVEVWAHPVDPSEFKPQSGLRQIANLVTGEAKVSPTTGKPSKAKNAVPACPGWELINITHARGPYKGSKGEVLSISDTHVLRARGPVQLDGSRRVAVGSWRDLAFDFAYIGILKDGRLDPLRRAGSDEMKDWIRGRDLPDPVQQPAE